MILHHKPWKESKTLVKKGLLSGSGGDQGKGGGQKPNRFEVNSTQGQTNTEMALELEIKNTIQGWSSAGRILAQHAPGPEFEPHYYISQAQWCIPEIPELGNT